MTRHAILQSKVESIDNLWIADVPVKPINVVRAVRTDNTVVLLDDKGRIYASGIKVGFSYEDGQINPRLQNAIACLWKLGRITAKAMEEHRKLNDQIRSEREARWNADSLATAAEKLGIKLTAAQQRKVDALRKEEA